MNKKLILSVVAAAILANGAFAKDYVKNDLRTMFLNNRAVIYELNMRTFNANDLNGNGIIELNKGETRGNFLNAIDRLDELKDLGINAIHVMPINPVGTKQALGTAGSLYSMKEIAAIDPNLADKNSDLDVKAQAKKFIDECHKRGIRVFVDLPACASVEMADIRPDLMLRNAKGEFVIPCDWTDVRLLKVVNKDGSLYKPLLDEHKKYVDMLLEIGADGIRADVAPIKSQVFWYQLIKYARSKDPQFMFLAETAEAWAPPSVPSPTADYKKLLNVGFDGYYGNCLDFLNFKSSEDLEKVFVYVNKMTRKGHRKAVIGCFDTHDLKSAYTVSKNYPQAIMYMNATLPLNPYYVDGFSTGDKYDYAYRGKTADTTYTDNNVYFTHKNQIDIFNYSRKPDGGDKEAFALLKKTLALREELGDIVTNGSFKLLDTSDDAVFAYERNYKKHGVIVAVNTDQKHSTYTTIKVNKKILNKYEVLTTIGEIDDARGKLVANIPAGKAVVIKYNLAKR